MTKIDKRSKQAFGALANVEVKIFPSAMINRIQTRNYTELKNNERRGFKIFPHLSCLNVLLRDPTLVLHPLVACRCPSFPASLCSQQFFLKDGAPLFRLLGGTTTSLSPPIPWFSGHNSWRWTRYEAILEGPRRKSRHTGPQLWEG